MNTELFTQSDFRYTLSCGAMLSLHPPDKGMVENVLYEINALHPATLEFL